MRRKSQSASVIESPALRYLTANPHWLLKADVHANLCAVMERHLNGVKLSADEIAAVVRADADKAAANNEPKMEIIDGVALIPITGVIAKYSSMVNGTSQPKGTSTETMSRLLSEAMQDPSVEAIVLDIESPGGNVAGLPDFADELFAAVESGVKPIVAYCNDMACSAAYWIASQCPAVYANQSAEVGSIGCYTYLIDSSAAAAQDGFRVIPITSGANKGTGIPGTPITDAQLQPISKTVNDIHAMFVKSVLRGRQQAGLRAEKLSLVADGRTMLAASALEAGLIDRIGTLQQAIDAAKEMAANPDRETIAAAASAAESNERIISMDDKKKVEAEKADTAAMDAARAQASEAVKAQFVALKEAFADDPAFALEAATEGLSVEAAKAKAYDRLKVTSAEKLAAAQEQIKTLTEDNAKYKALIGSKGIKDAPDFEAGDPQPVGNKEAKKDDGKPTAEAYSTRVKELTATGKKPADAYTQAAKELPEAHEAWTAAGCPAE